MTTAGHAELIMMTAEVARLERENEELREEIADLQTVESVHHKHYLASRGYLPSATMPDDLRRQMCRQIAQDELKRQMHPAPP